MSNYIAPDLIEAVGVQWRENDSMHRKWHTGTTLTYDYTGPALGTPELDALLLVAGVEKLREASKDGLFAILSKLPDHEFHNAALTLLVSSHPGHALARAIREVNHA